VVLTVNMLLTVAMVATRLVRRVDKVKESTDLSVLGLLAEEDCKTGLATPAPIVMQVTSEKVLPAAVTMEPGVEAVTGAVAGLMAPRVVEALAMLQKAISARASYSLAMDARFLPGNIPPLPPRLPSLPLRLLWHPLCHPR